jgi:hypothetical protein
MKKNSRVEFRQPPENVHKAYTSYLMKHPLSGNLNLEDIIDKALIMANDVFAFTCTEFCGVLEPSRIADRLGITIEHVTKHMSTQGENIPTAPYLFLAESIFGAKTIRVNVTALEELSADLRREGSAELLSAILLEKVALSHELFHLLFERYKGHLSLQIKPGRGATLAEEISAYEFSRLLLGLDHLPEILGALTRGGSQL